MILAHLDWSERAAPILEQMRIRERDAYPNEVPVLSDEPELGPGDVIGLRAYLAASSCRAIGFGIGPIPQTAIDVWCDRHGLDLAAADFLSDAVRYVDNVVLSREAAKRKAK